MINKRIMIYFIIFVTAIFLTSHSAANTDKVYSQAGDVTKNSAVLWGRCNQEQDSILKFKLSSLADKKIKKKKLKVSSKTDYTGSIVFKGLKPNTEYSYQAECKQKNGLSITAGMISGFTTPPDKHHVNTVRFIWAGDLAGQGWGRNPDLTITHIDGDMIQGGYVAFDSMSKLNPDFAIFQGDMIYADNPIPSSKAIPADVGGGTWTNNPTKDFVAITLDDFRANWKYNLGDKKMSHFLSQTPIYVQWDDHEVTNDWYPGKILPEGAPYFGVSVNELAKNAKQALFEFNPIKGSDLFRNVQHGKHLELFLLDTRSFRGANPDNHNPNGIEMLGKKQLAWLKKTLKKSKATWKIISSPVPLSLGSGDAWGQKSADVLGREVQLAEILSFIKDHDIKNIIFLTSDVHFTAAISYNPALATFKQFNPFWEFVIGPINAGAFGAGSLDESFGPQYEFLRAPSTEGIGQNSPPPHLQSFGLIEIDMNGELTIELIDITGSVLFEKTMLPL